ncbi:tetratricopeptide repeat protein (plasmid) [Burkholderia contaminans]|nr:tetratricopeptide repeat protein [Burkholderia contaminans]
MTDVDAAIKAGQYIQAEQLVKEAAPNHPGSPRIHYMLAQVLSRLPGREEEARQEYQQAMRLNPQLPFADTIEINALQERLRLNEPAHPRKLCRKRLCSSSKRLRRQRPSKRRCLRGRRSFRSDLICNSRSSACTIAACSSFRKTTLPSQLSLGCLPWC